MANPNALVDMVKGLSAPPETLLARAEPPPKFVTVRFQSGRSGLLDSASPRSGVWAGVLDSQRQANLPVYVEIDPETDVITELLCPLIVNVGEITPAGGGDFEVELIISQARHYLRAKQPDFDELLQRFRAAQQEKTKVIVTESDDHQIIDVTAVGNLEVQGQE